MIYYDDAVDMIVNLNKDYNQIKSDRDMLFLEISYLKQAIKELGLLQRVNARINKIKREEKPF